MATPVIDATGQPRGIYIINYLGEKLIAQMQNFVPRYKQRFRLLNPEGYWLRGAQPSQEWGFMLPERGGMTLAKTDPGLWAHVSTEPNGQMAYQGGYFTWHRVVLREAIANHPEIVQPQEPYLIMASEISPVEWSSLFMRLQKTFLIVGIILLFLIAFSWQFFHARQRARVELDRFFILTRDMLCIAGFDGHFKRVNSAWEKTLGYTSAELTSKPFVDFVHPDDRERTIAESAKLAQGGETVLFENRYRCKDGSYRWLSWSARSLINERLIFASARDLTERKHMDEQVLKLNADVKERAEQLEVANRELEAFSYSVSHDLRAPLRHIHGFVELLQKSPAIQGETTSLHRMGVIATAAKQMGMLIDDLLSFSRTSRAEMHLTEFRMRDVVEQVIDELKIEATGREVKWEVQDLPTVPGDPALLRLVWVNLLSNALKFTGPRAVAKIEIGQGTNEAPRPGEVVFFVQDNGVGFDMQYAAKLFGVFQRLHRTQDFEGTGIGLANVQRIIHRHGGRVWAKSTVDVGTTFYFSMPLIPPPNTKTL